MSMEDDWDFYPCRIDDYAASIVLNLRYAAEAPPAEATTLYRVRLPMREPDEHGMGTAAEAAAMNTFEDEVESRASEAGLIYVGRIRSRADWELVFYGAPDRAIQTVRDVFVDRRTYLDVRPDPDWGYYRDFLLPDAEREQWMHDRRLTEVLAREGDSLTTPRARRSLGTVRNGRSSRSLRARCTASGLSAATRGRGPRQAAAVWCPSISGRCGRPRARS